MRRNNIFFGLLILVIGVLLLLNSFGWMPENFWAIFWAGLLIVLGVWFLVAPAILKRSGNEETLNLPLEDAANAEITFEFGAGSLQVAAADTPGNLVQGSFWGGVEHHLKRSGSSARLKLRPPFPDIFPPFFFHRGFRWQVGLTRDIPLALTFKTGACESKLDLTDLKVDELKIETGASSTVVDLPARAGFTRVKAESGAASLELRVPQNVAARIRVDGGLSGINVDTRRFPRHNGEYESPDYGSAENRVDIAVETGVGSVDIR